MTRGCGHEESYLIHDMIYSIYNACVIACTFRRRVTLVRKINLLGIAHPIIEKYFQALEVHWRMKHKKKKKNSWLYCARNQVRNTHATMRTTRTHDKLVQ